MKIILSAVLSFLILNNSWANDEEFTWSPENDHGLKLGGRMETAEVLGTTVLLIQAAVKNQSAHPICVPVHIPNMGVQAVGLSYRLPCPKDGPFGKDGVYRLIYPTVYRDPFVSHAGGSVRYVQIEPGAIMKFSPIIADLSGMHVLPDLESVIHLNTKSPNGANQLFLVTFVDGRGYGEEYSTNYDLGMFPTEKWEVVVKLAPKKPQAEQDAAPNP